MTYFSPRALRFIFTANHCIYGKIGKRIFCLYIQCYEYSNNAILIHTFCIIICVEYVSLYNPGKSREIRREFREIDLGGWLVCMPYVQDAISNLRHPYIVISCDY